MIVASGSGPVPPEPCGIGIGVREAVEAGELVLEHAARIVQGGRLVRPNPLRRSQRFR